MGRTVKRVPLDFRWPLHMRWRGYVNPYHAQDCRACGASGENPETKRIADAFYPHSCPPDMEPWRDKITQDEVDALVSKGRLRRWDSASREWRSEPHPTAAEVNAAQARGFGGDFAHDAINRWILVETRAKRLGVYGQCEFCEGEGSIWATPEVRAAHEAWEDFDPPSGPGWQLWETTSEGSPVSPVFATPEELARWCADGATSFGDSRESYETWLGWFARYAAPAREPDPASPSPESGPASPPSSVDAPEEDSR